MNNNSIILTVVLSIISSPIFASAPARAATPDSPQLIKVVPAAKSPFQLSPASNQTPEHKAQLRAQRARNQSKGKNLSQKFQAVSSKNRLDGKLAELHQDFSVNQG